MKIGSLCSGYGGLEFAVTAALSAMGVTATTGWHAEIDPDASTVLKHRFDGVPNLGDLTKIDWSCDDLPCDLLVMGVPCQPVSTAGRQQAENDPRWLWPDALRGLVALRPRLLVFENVRNLVSIRKGEVWRTVLADMRAAGYAVRWLTLGACAVGAPHHRHRVFAVGAYVGPGAPGAVHVDAPECGARRGNNYRNARGEPGGMASVTRLFATPTASEDTGAGHAAQGGENLRTQVSLLTDDRFGPYAAAVARWETLRGVPAPEPTETGPRGGRRLAPAFPEWMMGLEPGWITGVPGVGRTPALRMTGNGVCPQQATAAIDLLLAGRDGE